MTPADSARLRALARLLVDEGHLTPAGQLQLHAVLDDAQQEPHTPLSRPESPRSAQNHTDVSSSPQDGAQRLDDAPDGTLLGIERPGPSGRVDALDVYERQDSHWLRYGDGAWCELDPDHLIWPHRILWQPGTPRRRTTGGEA